LGGSKEKESLRELIRSTRLLGLSFGRVDVRIAKPFSLKTFIDEQVGRRSTTL
jgi:glycerol-3-phosphate O-acyltransferase